MNIYLALSLIFLPLAHGITFESAIGVNLCGIQFNGGQGFGRVEMITVSAKCADRRKMDLVCNYTLPHNGGSRDSFHDCWVGDKCVQSTIAEPHRPDAGCLPIPSPSGVKGAAKANGHACSSGIWIGDVPLALASSISTDNPQYENGLKSCQIVKSGTSNSIYTSSPCSKTTTVIRLAARTTYQACIDVTSALLKTSVGFTWHLDSLGKRSRGLEQHGRPLSEMLTVLGGNSTADDAFRIVIGDGEM